MRPRKFFNTIIPLVTLLSLLGMASCSKGSTAKKDSNIDYWTCTMHPSVHSKDPGKCPICSMDLVPVLKKGGGEAKPTPAQGGETKGSEMKGMAGMPGMKQGDMKAGEKPSEFVVPVEPVELPDRQLVSASERGCRIANSPASRCRTVAKASSPSESVISSTPFR